jgi:hypothetical protein
MAPNKKVAISHTTSKTYTLCYSKHTPIPTIGYAYAYCLLHLRV